MKQLSILVLVQFCLCAVTHLRTKLNVVLANQKRVLCRQKMLVGQFTKLFKSHAYRLFCYMIKLDGYEHKLRLLKEECQCVICENDSPHKKFNVPI